MLAAFLGACGALSMRRDFLAALAYAEVFCIIGEIYTDDRYLIGSVELPDWFLRRAAIRK
jgi:hypothetical protein